MQITAKAMFDAFREVSCRKRDKRHRKIERRNRNPCKSYPHKEIAFFENRPVALEYYRVQAKVTLFLSF